MSAQKKDRWFSHSFHKETRGYCLEVVWSGGPSWEWRVWHSHASASIGQGIEKTEKAAKLAARRFVDRHPVSRWPVSR